MLFTAFFAKRTDVVGQLKSLQAETDMITKIFEDPEVMRQMQSSRWETDEFVKYITKLLAYIEHINTRKDKLRM